MSPTLGFPPKPLAPSDDARKKPVTASPVASRVAATSEKDMEIAALRQQVARLQAAEDLRSRSSAPKPTQSSNIGGLMAQGGISSGANPHRGAQVRVLDHDVVSDGSNLNDIADVVRNDVPTARSVGAPKFMDPVSGIGPSVVPLVAYPPSSTPSGLPPVSPVGVVGGGYTSQPLPPGGASVYATSGHYVIPSAPSTMSVPGMQSSPSIRVNVTWPTFRGLIGEDARRFLAEFELAALASGVMGNDSRMITIIASQSLKDGALTWFLSCVVGSSGLTSYLANTTWSTFQTAFASRWVSALQLDQARLRFESLRHTGSMEQFVGEFTSLTAQLPGAFSEGQLVFAFTAKLAPDAQQFVRLQQPTSMDAAVRLAYQYASATGFTPNKSAHTISINDTEVQPAIPTSFNADQVAQLFAFLGHAKPAPWSKGSSSSSPRRSGLPPRHLFKISQEEYDRRLRDNACLTCGKTGHQSRQCQLRPKPTGSQNAQSA